MSVSPSDPTPLAANARAVARPAPSATRRLPAWPPREAEPAEALSLRQLRHHSGNTWQRLLCEIWTMAEDAGTPEAYSLAEEVERRLSATVAVADALFGLTRRPGRMQERLEVLARQAIAVQAHSHQLIGLDVAVQGACPAALQQTVLRIAQEMVCNAVKHGFHARARGQIAVTLIALPGRPLQLEVGDDGWGPPPQEARGEGMALMRELAAQNGGRVSLKRDGGLTLAELELPWP
ncbi:ATP-binding protein [Teichococcus deserti]|uniref:ATP-binding protein n=1 Tax=Teichococcus deserti TaxID=1817963 RepID=UPI001054CE04|nr:ATP-binding protein [Pseudoroseomonas deserti]